MIVIAACAIAIYLAIGVLYLRLRERPRGLGLEGILDLVVWWLPDLLRGRLSGTRWRCQPVEWAMGGVLAICVLASPITILARHLVLVLMVGVMALGAGAVLAPDAHGAEAVVLDPASVDLVAQQLSRIVDEKAAALHAATQPDHGDNALDHLIVSAINMVVGFLLAIGFGLLLHRKAVEKGLLPNIDEIRDAVQHLRQAWTKRAAGALEDAMTQPERDAEKQAGLVLLAGALPTAAYIIGVYMVIASLATPHG